MSNVHTVASHFGVDAAPADETIRLAGQGPQRLVLDILEITGGNNATVQVVATELIPSVKEIQILSDDGNALDTFTPGRTIRGSQSGKHATVVSQRTASSVDYVSYADTGPSKYFVGEVIQEVGLTGAATAAIAKVSSLPTQSYIEGDEVADTTAVDADTVVDISQAKRDKPAPHRPRLVRLSYTFTGSPTSGSFIVRVSG